MQPIHPLVYAGLGAGLVLYLFGLLLTYFFITPRILRFLPGLLGLVASIVLLCMAVYHQQQLWKGIAAFSLALTGTCLIGLVLLIFQLFYQLSRARTEHKQ